jgi:hypothetical protein
MSQGVEDFVATYGEEQRKLITDALDWLREAEPKWCLAKPMDKREFVRNLMSEAQRWCEEK